MGKTSRWRSRGFADAPPTQTQGLKMAFSDGFHFFAGVSDSSEQTIEGIIDAAAEALMTPFTSQLPDGVGDRSSVELIVFPSTPL
jgi:hypothetical protein